MAHRSQMERASSGHGAPELDVPATVYPSPDDWVHEAIAMTRPGVEIQFPVRRINDREIPFVYDDFR